MINLYSWPATASNTVAAQYPSNSLASGVSDHPLNGPVTATLSANGAHTLKDTPLRRTNAPTSFLCCPLILPLFYIPAPQTANRFVPGDATMATGLGHSADE